MEDYNNRKGPSTGTQSNEVSRISKSLEKSEDKTLVDVSDTDREERKEGLPLATNKGLDMHKVKA